MMHTTQKTCSAGKAPQAARPACTCGSGSAQIAQSLADWLNGTLLSCRWEFSSREETPPWFLRPLGDEDLRESMAARRGDEVTNNNLSQRHNSARGTLHFTQNQTSRRAPKIGQSSASLL